MAMLEVAHLKKVYTTRFGGNQVEALRDVSFTVEQGEYTAIMGESGSGKTTLLNILAALDKPTSGMVQLDGNDLTQIKESRIAAFRRDHLGFVFQDFNLLEQRTVLRNVLFPLELAGTPRAEAKKRALELLQLVGLSERTGAYPSQLSGGQKQRVAIARALATSPRYLLCDEATSALDPTTTGQILELLAKINRELGVTIIVITHEMKVIDAICHRVAVIDRSHIAEEGPVSEVFVNPQSAIAQELILQKDRRAPEVFSGQRIRIVFDDKTANKPVISDLILACQAPVNIIFADTREVGGIVYGHMIVQLPQDERQRDKITAWLHANNITFKEEV